MMSPSRRLPPAQADDVSKTRHKIESSPAGVRRSACATNPTSRRPRSGSRRSSRRRRCGREAIRAEAHQGAHCERIASLNKAGALTLKAPKDRLR